MLKVYVPKARPKSLAMRSGTWGALSLEGPTPPENIDIGHILNAKIRISGRTVLNMDFNVATGDMDALDGGIWYYVVVWVPLDALDDDLSIEIEPVGINEAMTFRDFLKNPPTG